jgi:hypothetical protein
LLGDPDSVITLTRTEEGQRYIRAIGRDVDVAEDRLEYDGASRRMHKTGEGSRSKAKAMAKLEHQVTRRGELLTQVLAAVRANPGMSQKRLALAVPGRDADIIAAAQEAENLGSIEIRKGGRGVATTYWPTGSQPTLPN